MISTSTSQLLPNKEALQKTCMSISLLEAILSPEWEYRYYSYNSRWSDDEEFCEMRNGHGDQILILFRKDSCAINGFAHEYEQPDKKQITAGLPDVLQEFIFGEPVNSIGTTFCLWTIESAIWQTGVIEDFDDSSEELLYIFDGNPQTYMDWASDYYEESFSITPDTQLVIRQIYDAKPLTKDMVMVLNPKLDDWELLKSDLAEIGYPHQL